MVRFAVKVPKKLLENAMVEDIRQGAVEWAELVQKDFLKTTQGWKTRVRFRIRIDFMKKQIKVNVFTGNKIYGWVSRGTPERIIRPRAAKALRFRANYYRRTIPGVIGSSPGGRSFGPVVFRRWVKHKIEARKFDEVIGALRKPDFERIMLRQLNKAAQSSGHAIP